MGLGPGVSELGPNPASSRTTASKASGSSGVTNGFIGLPLSMTKPNFFVGRRRSKFSQYRKDAVPQIRSFSPHGAERNLSDAFQRRVGDVLSAKWKVVVAYSQRRRGAFNLRITVTLTHERSLELIFMLSGKGRRQQENYGNVTDVAVTNFVGLAITIFSPHFENTTSLETCWPLTTPESVSATGRFGAVVETYSV
jgi:hypothetical protein